MSDLTDKLKNAKEKIVEVGAKAKDSKAAEAMAKGIKGGAEVVAKGAKAGADAVAKGAKAGAEKVKETVDGIGTDKVREDGHTVVALNGSKMKLLLPDGYTKLKRSNVVNQIVKAVQNTEVVYQKIVDYSNNAVIIWKTTKEKSMDCSEVQPIIDGIHECLAENQGVIEVKNGTTKRGYNYIYSIVKTLADEDGIPLGVRYFLRMTLNVDDEYIEINGFFEEQGMTGLRESMSTEFARRAGLVEFTEEGLAGWSEDPYDASYTNGIVKNLAEREGLDGIFPYNPLTQARELVLAIVNDELVIIQKEDSEEDSSDTKEKIDEKEFCLKLFEDVCKRHTYPVEVEAQKVQEEKAESDKREEKVTAESVDSASEEKNTDTVNVKDILNTVIDGAYAGQTVSIAKNKLFVGEKEVTTLNCESYRNPEKRECVINTKELFESFKKKSKNPLDKMIKDSYITVVWRTGEKSVLCVDPVKKAMVIKLLS